MASRCPAGKPLIFCKPIQNAPSVPPTQLPGLITVSDSPSPPAPRETQRRRARGREATRSGRGFHPASAPAMPRPRHGPGEGSNASLDLGTVQKPQFFPHRSEQRSDALPTILVKQNEASAFPVNLTCVTNVKGLT